MSGGKKKYDEDPLEGYPDVDDQGLGTFDGFTGKLPSAQDAIAASNMAAADGGINALMPPKQQQQIDPLDTLPDVDPNGPSNPEPPPLQKTPAPDDNWMERFFNGPAGDSMGLQQLPGAPDQELLDTIGDTGVGAANGLTLNNGDELAGLFGKDAQDAVRSRVDLAHQRSPIGSRVGEAAGGAALNAMLPGSGAAATLAKAAGTGFASGVGAENDGSLTDSLKAGGKSAALNMATAALPLAAGSAGKLAGKTANVLGNYADSGNMARHMQYAGASALAYGRPATAAAMTAGSFVAPQVTGAVAGPLGKGLQAAGQGLSSAASSLAGMASTAEGRKAADMTASQGDQMESQIRKAMAQGPQALGKYSQMFSEAAKNGTTGALIDKLENSDEEFRTKVSPWIRSL
jgi:hypothetical protein